MAEPPLPSGMVTFLLTDVEGSTRIWEADRGRARIAFERHDALVAEHLASFGGAAPRIRARVTARSRCSPVRVRRSGARSRSNALFYAEAWPAARRSACGWPCTRARPNFANGNYKGSAVHRCARSTRARARRPDRDVGGHARRSSATSCRDDVTLARHGGARAPAGSCTPSVCTSSATRSCPPTFRRCSRDRDARATSRGCRRCRCPRRSRNLGGGCVRRPGRGAGRSRTAWDTAGPLGARMVLIGGEAGIGKSRLAAQFAATVHERGAHGAVRAMRRGGTAAVPAVRRSVEHLPARVARRSSPVPVGPERHRARRLVPELSDRYSGPRRTRAGATRSRSGSACSRRSRPLLTELSCVGAGPARARRSALGRQGDAAAGSPLGPPRGSRAALPARDVPRRDATSSPTPFADMLIALDREHVVTHIRLRGLDDADVTALLDPARARDRMRERWRSRRRCAMERKETRSSSARCCATSQRTATSTRRMASGSPVRGSIGSGFPVGCAGSSPSASPGSPSPPNRVLAAAAVIGREFRLDVLDAVTDLDEESVFETLDDAVRAGLVARCPRSWACTCSRTPSYARRSTKD